VAAGKREREREREREEKKEGGTGLSLKSKSEVFSERYSEERKIKSVEWTNL